MSTTSIPALFDALRAADSNTRSSAAMALGQIGEPAIPALLIALQDSRDDTRIAAASAIGVIGAPAREAIPLLIHLLSKDSIKARSAAASALGQMGPNASAAVPALTSALANTNEELSEAAATALGKIGPKASSSVPALITCIGSTALAIRIGAIKALGEIGPTAKNAIPALSSALRDHNRIVAIVASYSLFEIGTESLPELLAALQDPRPEVRERAAAALAEYGPEAAMAVPALVEALHDPDLGVRQEAVKGIGNKGAAAQSAIPALVLTLDSPDEWVSKMAATNLVEISKALASKDEGLSDHELNKAISDVNTIRIALARADLRKTDQVSSFNSPQALAAIELARGTLSGIQRSRRRQRLVGPAVGLSIILALFVTYLLVPELRRSVQLRLGRRWYLSPGICPWIVEVSNGVLVLRDTVNARPIVAGISLKGWPVEPEVRELIRKSLPPSSNVRVVVDAPLFKYPWCHELGTAWSGGSSAVVAGQLCMLPEARVNRSVSGESNLVVSALACGNYANLRSLQAVDEEISSVTACFRRWGAMVLQPNFQAEVGDFRHALLHSDVVHVAAHAGPEGLYLKDQIVSSVDLEDMLLTNIRCRLLVLSACSLGRFEDDRGLVFRLVLGGVNVLAALQPVADHVCSVFFEQFYRALLPQRQAHGIDLGSAIRQAADACAIRLKEAEEKILPEWEFGQWKKHVDSFVLYGDPSAHFSLQ